MSETKYWTWHIFAGVIILFLLGLHMITMHLDHVIPILNPAGGSALDWQNVVYRARIVAMTVIYIILLGVALYHGLYGLRTILFELILNKGLKTLINLFFWIAGFCLFMFGTYSAIAARLIS